MMHNGKTIDVGMGSPRHASLVMAEIMYGKDENNWASIADEP